MRRRTFLASGTAAVAGLAGCSNVTRVTSGGSGEFPSETIRYLIPYAEGGGTDTYARGIRPSLEEEVGVDIAIDNMPGAGGMIAFGQLANADPDGYTICGTSSPSEVAPQLEEEVNFDQRDFESLGAIGTSTNVLIVNPDYRDEVEDFADLREKYNSGEWETIGSEAPASDKSIMQLLMKHEFDGDDEWNLQWDRQVRYDGTGEQASAVASGEVPAGLVSDVGAVSFIEDDQVYPILVMATFGSGPFPDVPTPDDRDLPGMDFIAGTMRGLFTTPGTPQDRVDQLAEHIENAVGTDEYQEWGEETGNVTTYFEPDRFASFIEDAVDDMQEYDALSLVEEHT